jgi:rubrerythrin
VIGVVDAIYDVEFIRTMIIEKYPKKTVAVQDSWGAWWTYCPGCGRIRLELNPDRVPKACPVCNRKVEVTLPAHT